MMRYAKLKNGLGKSLDTLLVHPSVAQLRMR
jgi:hypothetical protein